jgi:signal transduction histidine kinase
MNVKLRFGLLFGALLVGFALALLVQQWLDQREQLQIAAQLRLQREAQLDHWLGSTGRGLRHYATECATALSAAGLESNEAEVGDPVDAGADALWVVRSNGSLTRAVGSPGLQVPPFTTTVMAAWNHTPPPAVFFCEQNGRLLEVFTAAIPASGTAVGWVLIARTWDAAHLEVLGQLTEGRISLVTPLSGDTMSDAVITRPLPDLAGRPLSVLQVAYPTLPPAGLWQFRAPQTQLFFVFGLFLIVALALSLQRWVLHPLGLINTSLTKGESTPIAGLLAGEDELSRIARLLDTSFTQSNTLRQEIEKRRRIESALLTSEADLRRTLDERTRLGRDLHDGVIQSLYATGMGLAGVRALLHPEQTEALARLDQSRAAINETIHDVRNFITGLEPEVIRQQTFAHAVTALLELMQGIQPVRSSAEINDELAARLTLTQRANILQIIREAVSNALRHGAATRIHVALTPDTGGGIRLEITDDGRGFSPGTEGHAGGRGLDNFTQRARELDASFTLQSEPGQGARLRFVFNPPRHES